MQSIALLYEYNVLHVGILHLVSFNFKIEYENVNEIKGN